MRREKVSDARDISGSLIVLVVRVGCVVLFADTLATLVFRRPFWPVGGLIVIVFLLGSTIAAGYLLGEWDFIPGLLWNGCGLGAILFLGVAFQCHRLGLTSRSRLVEYSTIGLCLGIIGITVVRDRWRSRKT
jgi:hypothetical protein